MMRQAEEARPTTKGVGSAAVREARKPRRGMIVYWAAVPRSTRPGVRAMLEKSCAHATAIVQEQWPRLVVCRGPH